MWIRLGTTIHFNQRLSATSRCKARSQASPGIRRRESVVPCAPPPPAPRPGREGDLCPVGRSSAASSQRHGPGHTQVPEQPLAPSSGDSQAPPHSKATPLSSQGPRASGRGRGLTAQSPHVSGSSASQSPVSLPQQDHLQPEGIQPVGGIPGRGKNTPSWGHAGEAGLGRDTR